MLGNPVDPPVLVAMSAAVKIREVRAISRKDQGAMLWNPQRPYARPAVLTAG
jgi:hypothetical protein